MYNVPRRQLPIRLRRHPFPPLFPGRRVYLPSLQSVSGRVDRILTTSSSRLLRRQRARALSSYAVLVGSAQMYDATSSLYLTNEQYIRVQGPRVYIYMSKNSVSNAPFFRPFLQVHSQRCYEYINEILFFFSFISRIYIPHLLMLLSHPNTAL